MAWPQLDEFQAAVQNPNTAFRDTDLKASTPITDALGLPKTATGTFASVYCLVEPTGKKWAVRSFNIQPAADQRDRYQAVSQHLSGIVMPLIVGFEYQEQGILVNGNSYPIIKMEWVEGISFGRFVEDYYTDPPVLRYAAAQFRGVVAGLQGAHIAHGDFQHGNIINNPQGQFVLVDYDGMFVPSLSGKGAVELGMPNYQHPKRSANDFTEWLDNFSALVIYMSLGALAADALLFQKHNNGDNLVLEENDYKDTNAKVWLDLAHSPEKVVVGMTDIIRQACKGPIDKVPSLEDALRQTGSLPSGKKPVAQTVQPVAPQSIPRPVVIPAPTQPQPALAPTPAPPPSPKIPQIQISTTRLDFGELLVGASEQLDFEIQNPGTGDLQINSVNCLDPTINILGFQNLIPANGGKAKRTAVYQPAQIGDLNAVIEIDSNAGKKQIALVGKVTDKAIIGISPSPLYAGDEKEILIHGFGFEKRVVTKQIATGRGRTQQTQTMFDEFLPSVTALAPGIVINNIEFSPTTLRGFIEIPKNCPAGTYDIVVTNPIDPANPKLVQIISKNKLEIQDVPSGQIKCKKCGVLMSKPVDIPKNAAERETWFCPIPSCRWHQAIMP